MDGGAAVGARDGFSTMEGWVYYSSYIAMLEERLCLLRDVVEASRLDYRRNMDMLMDRAKSLLTFSGVLFSVSVALFMRPDIVAEIKVILFLEFIFLLYSIFASIYVLSPKRIDQIDIVKYYEVNRNLSQNKDSLLFDLSLMLKRESEQIMKLNKYMYIFMRIGYMTLGFSIIASVFSVYVGVKSW